jgi:hypothetical protein
MPVETLAKVYVAHCEESLKTPKFDHEVFENGQIWNLFEKYFPMNS